MDERCTDEIESNNPDQRARSAAAELLRIRASLDSRRAEQIRKLRWAVENAITKIEAVPDPGGQP